ncbi:helix-turn-helix transcriptional regulator [Herbiconiux moechotypicola]|nr:helix-turn-helix transcriptional regulator [Herbiconiux moechotypicola]MCS5731835.1 helix-turn-helix transcriptional regulator [Herbiconiux moechotypicola]
MTTVDAMTRARRRKRLSVAEVARRSGLQPSNLSAIESGSREPTARNLERAARGAGLHLLVVDLHGRSSAADIAGEIAEAEPTGDRWRQARLFVQLSDDLVGADPFVKVLIAAEPPRPIDAEWDAAIAGLVEWRLTQFGLPLPEWVSDALGDVESRWSIWPGAVRVDAAEVPAPLLRRGVWVSGAELESA